MNLSEAIRKRNTLNERARAMDKWYIEQYNYHNIPWHEMNKVIKEVVDNAWEEYFELNKRIEDFIEKMELPKEDGE